MTKNPKPDKWPLRAGDLPDETVRQSEPLLQTLEYNPLFRLMMFAKRTSRRRWSEPRNLGCGWASVILFASLVFLGFSSVLFAVFVVGGLLALASRMRQTMGRHRLWRLSHFYNAPADRLEDLLEAGIDPKDCAVAFWGQRINPSGEGLNFGVNVMGVAAGCFGVLLMVSNGAFFESSGESIGISMIPGFLLFASTFGLTRLRYTPYHVLPVASWSCGRLRQQVWGDTHHSKIATMILSIFLLLFSMPLLAVGVTILFFCISVLISLLSEFFGPYPVGPSFVIASSLIGGVSSGLYAGWVSKKQADEYLKSMRGEFKQVLDLLEEDRQQAKP